MEEDSDSDNDFDEINSSSREGVVKFKLSKETKRRIRGPWAKAIIVKLVGKTVGLNFMQSKLNQIWRPEGRLDCVDLTYGFFLVKFYSKDDLEKVIKRGPWFIGNHFLSLRPWEPFFKPSSTTMSSVAIWIRLNELPIELYETEVLKDIGEAIGKVLRIDSHIAMEARGRVGHKVDSCPYTICKEKEPLAPTEEVQGAQANINGAGQPNDMHNACEETDKDGWCMGLG
ncbi:uncharacterized protein LOC142628589 [Castanea sativa]|uniref:uncharacterized protein LOC142628589 n=1 Tax=Castanea sativa TaxID=21020 RepID=UPI003F654748